MFFFCYFLLGLPQANQYHKNIGYEKIEAVHCSDYFCVQVSPLFGDLKTQSWVKLVTLSLQTLCFLFLCSIAPPNGFAGVKPKICKTIFFQELDIQIFIRFLLRAPFHRFLSLDSCDDLNDGPLSSEAICASIASCLSLCKSG